MTDEKIVQLLAAGTTTRPEQLTVLYNDGTTALVKHPGGYDGGRRWCRAWVSPWVAQYDLAKLDKGKGGAHRGTVWDCDEKANGRLSQAKLRQLVDTLGLEQRFIRPAKPKAPPKPKPGPMTLARARRIVRTEVGLALVLHLKKWRELGLLREDTETAASAADHAIADAAMDALAKFWKTEEAPNGSEAEA